MMSPNPPQPLPTDLWGDRWQFASLAARDLEDRLLAQPIPVRAVQPGALPSQVPLGESTRVPGVVIEGGRQSMKLARWLADRQPQWLEAMAQELGGLILAAHPNERWVIATYDDDEVKQAAAQFRTRQQQAQGVHFLLVQPDDSGLTYSGLWVLRRSVP